MSAHARPCSIANAHYSVGPFCIIGFLRVDGNRFHGSIPTEIGNMMSIRELWMQENRMYGTIPTQVGELTDLSELRASSEKRHCRSCGSLSLTQVTLGSRPSNVQQSVQRDHPGAAL